MTLNDTFDAIKHYWKIAVAIPLLFVLCCGGVFLVQRNSAVMYQATVSIIPNSYQKTLSGVCETEASVLRAAHPGYSFTITVETISTAVNVSVSGADPEVCASLSEELASEADKAVSGMGGESDYQAPYNSYITSPVISSVEKSVAKSMGYLAIALVAGVAVALFVIFLAVAIRKPVISGREVEEVTGAPCLGSIIQEDRGIAFAVEIVCIAQHSLTKLERDSLVRNICFVSLGVSDEPGLTSFCELLGDALKEKDSRKCDAFQSDKSESSFEERVSVIDGRTLGSSLESVHSAHVSDAVVVVARPWSDSIGEVDRVIKELRLMGANVIGFVLA